MTTPQAWVSSLDRSLAANGEDAILQNLSGFEAAVRAFVRQYLPHELAGGIIQGDSRVILSATDIAVAQWHSGAPAGDPLVPIKGNKIILAGRARNIEAATPFYIAGTLARIELQIRG